MVGALFLAGCGKTDTPQGNEQPSETSLAKAFLENLAPKMEKTAQDIKAGKLSFQRLENEVPWYRLVNDAFPPQHEFRKVIDEVFEWWVVEFEGDGVWASVTSYLNDNLFCNVVYEVNHDLNGVLERLYSDDPAEQEAANEEMEKIFAESTSTVTVECAEATQESFSPLEFTFSMWGGEPFWNAELRMNTLLYSTPNLVEDGKFYDTMYIDQFGKSGETLTFSTNHYKLGEIKGILTKATCHDEREEPNAYQVTIHFGDHTYEGCANKIDNLLVSWREGNLATLFKKIGYTYQGTRDPKTMRYSGIQAQDNLVSLMLSWEAPETWEYEENWEYLVIGKTGENWETYWQGGYSVDDETCEKYVNVPWLMDFSMFSSCPRG